MSSATDWLERTPAARESALDRLSASDPRFAGAAMPDVLLDHPEVLGEAAAELVGEALRRGAPVGVAEELLAMHRQAARGARELSPHVRQTLSSLRGMRDYHEVAPVLEAARDAATTQSDRDKVTALLATARRSSVADEPIFLGPDDLGATSLSLPDCAACCLLGCGICVPLPPAPVTCAVCCIVGCVVCG